MSRFICLFVCYVALLFHLLPEPNLAISKNKIVLLVSDILNWKHLLNFFGFISEALLIYLKKKGLLE